MEFYDWGNVCFNNRICLILIYSSGLLTKKFINLLKHAQDGILDLNKAAETLEVSFFFSEQLVSYMMWLYKTWISSWSLLTIGFDKTGAEEKDL